LAFFELLDFDIVFINKKLLVFLYLFVDELFGLFCIGDFFVLCFWGVFF